MECHQGNDFAGGNMVKFQSGNSGNNVNEKRNDPVNFNSKSNDEGRLLGSQSEIELSNKRARNSFSVDLAGCDMPKAIGNMFFRTKLCLNFQAGTCRHTTNCRFAHSMQELRGPPSDWREILAVHNVEPSKEAIQIPVEEFSGEAARGYKHYCKEFHTEEGCLYGDCTLHDELRSERPTEAICLVAGSGYGHGSTGINSVPVGPNPSWRTKICMKWLQTGFCAYRDNCDFAHGAAELHHYGGGRMIPEVNGSSTHDTNHGPELAKASATAVDKPVASVPHSYQARKIPNVMPKIGEVPPRRWKGPNKISKIYGDWIDDL